MTLDDALNLAWQHKDLRRECPRPDVVEACAIIDEALDVAKFNWLTGQKAYVLLRAELSRQVKSARSKRKRKAL